MIDRFRRALVRSVIFAAIGGLLMGSDSAAPAPVFASQAGAALDSDLLKGGGTEDTAVLQRILDRAKQGRAVHLVIDGPALIAGLDVHSNTTIECIAGGGFYLKDDTARAMLRNANRSPGKVIDKRITIRGCFLNGNSGNQDAVGPATSTRPQHSIREIDGTYRSGLQFLGVHYLIVEHVTLWDIVAWASWIANGKFIHIHNVIVDGDFSPYPEGADISTVRAWLKENAIGLGRVAGGGDDGLHFTGPIQYLTVDGVKIRTWDDGLALTANLDCGAVTEEKLKVVCAGYAYSSPYANGGPISDVTINNVIFMDGHHGIRLISADNRVDRILISNVTGTIRERFAVISHFFPGRTGNFGSITFSNINVDLANFPPWTELFPGQDIKKRISEFEVALASGTRPELIDVGEEAEIPLFSLNGYIENLSLRHVVTRVGDVSRPIIRVGHDTIVQRMNIDLDIHDPAAQSVPLKLMGRIEHLNWSLAWPGKQPIEDKGGSIGRLQWRNGSCASP